MDISPVMASGLAVNAMTSRSQQSRAFAPTPSTTDRACALTSPRIEFDVSRWPLVIVAYPAQYSNEEWKAHNDWVRAKLKEGRSFAAILDTRNTQPPTAQQRRAVSARFVADRKLWEEHYIAGAVVVTSALMRGVVTAIQWLSPPPFPSRVFTNMDDAVDWVTRRIREYDARSREGKIGR